MATATTRKQTDKPKKAETPNSLTVFINDRTTPYFHGYVTEEQAAIVSDIVRYITPLPAPDGATRPTAPPLLDGPIIDQRIAERVVDEILNNSDHDSPEPLARLLVSLKKYQTAPAARDAFDWLLTALYKHSPEFYKGCDEFVASQDAAGIPVEITASAGR